MNAPLKKCSAYGADIITPHLPQAVFQRRVSTDTDTVFASARPGTTGKTITAERMNPFPTIMDFGTGKTIANGRAMLAPTGCGKKLKSALT